jgi:hypothetical protein
MKTSVCKPMTEYYLGRKSLPYKMGTEIWLGMP